MVQKIKAELVKNLRAQLKKANNPKKKEYSRREALEELKPVIAELRDKGFDFEQIADIITQKSEEILKATAKDLSSLFRVNEEKIAEHDNKELRHKSDTPPNDEKL